MLSLSITKILKINELENEKYRGQKIGKQLMDDLKKEAIVNNCGHIKWTVPPWNEAGKRFYERLGAKENNEWINYEWSV